jgi:hypothetical protein
MRKQLIKWTVLDYRGWTSLAGVFIELLIYVSFASWCWGVYSVATFLTLMTIGVYVIHRFSPKDREYSVPRIARPAFGLFTLGGSLMGLGLSDSLSFIPVGIALAFLIGTHIYFNYISPVKWEELDDSQKLQYGELAQSSFSDKGLTPEQLEEWLFIKERLSRN